MFVNQLKAERLNLIKSGLLHISVFNMVKIHFKIYIIMILSFYHYDAIRVLQLQDNISSDDNVTVELENSSLDKLKQFTLCGRFLTPYLPNMKSNIQSLLYGNSMYFMMRIELRSCEDRYPGCTRFYKDDLGIHLDYSFH